MSAPDFVQVKLQIGTNVIETGTGDWTLDHIRDFRTIEAEVSIEENASSDGGFIRDIRYPSRLLFFVISSERRSKAQILATQRQLSDYIDFKADASLTIYDNGTTLVALGTLLEAKIPNPDSKKTIARPVLAIKFLMPDPFYVSEAIEHPFTRILPSIYAPMSVLVDVGSMGGLVVAGNELTFTVGGQDAPGFELTLTATDTVVNPKVTNADGKYIKVLGTFTAGRVIVISTIAMEVTCDGEENERDIRSTMFYLSLGSNTLIVSADSGVDSLTKRVRFFERYRT